MSSRAGAWALAVLALVAVPLVHAPLGGWGAGDWDLPGRALATAVVVGTALALRAREGGNASAPESRATEPRATAGEWFVAGLLCAWIELDQPWPVRAGPARVLTASAAAVLAMAWLQRRRSAVPLVIAALTGVLWIVVGTHWRLPEPEGHFARLRWGLGTPRSASTELAVALALVLAALARSALRFPLACVAGLLALGPLPLLTSGVARLCLRRPLHLPLALGLVASLVALGGLHWTPFLRPMPAALVVGALLHSTTRRRASARRYPPDPRRDAPHAADAES